MKKTASVISTIILVLMLVAVAALAVPRLFGVKLYTVLSGSMEPEYKVGDIVYVVPAEFEEIKEGDVISYVLNEQLTIVTHRVVSINTEEQRFTTKGDANEVEDGSTVMYGNVLGVVRFSIPKVGFIADFASKTSGKIIIAGIIVCFAVLSIALDEGKRKKNSIEENAQDELPENVGGDDGEQARDDASADSQGDTVRDAD